MTAMPPAAAVTFAAVTMTGSARMLVVSVSVVFMTGFMLLAKIVAMMMSAAVTTDMVVAMAMTMQGMARKNLM